MVIDTERLRYRREKIGQSVLGLPLYLLRLSSPTEGHRETLVFLARQGASDGNASLVM